MATKEQLKQIVTNPAKAELWNLGERKVFKLLSQQNGTMMSAADMRSALFPKRNKVKMERHVRNSLRRLVRDGFVVNPERGQYRLSPKARRALK